MKAILILVFSMSVVFAQKNVSRDYFMVNIRPVLNGILSDFYQMISLFPDFPKEIIPIVQEMVPLIQEKEALMSACPRLIGQNCLEQLSVLQKRLTDLKILSLKLMTHQKVSRNLHLNSMISQRFITEFDNELEQVKGLIDNSSLLLKAKVSHKRETHFIIRELDELHALLSLAVVESIPVLYQDDFKLFFNNFIHPLQQQISKQKNFEYLNRNIDVLNFSLNLLNMQLTKRKKTPEGMAPYLSTIHNRWNSILRYYW
jgi:hypothetical protein